MAAMRSPVRATRPVIGAGAAGGKVRSTRALGWRRPGAKPGDDDRKHRQAWEPHSYGSDLSRSALLQHLADFRRVGLLHHAAGAAYAIVDAHGAHRLLHARHGRWVHAETADAEAEQKRRQARIGGDL